MPITSPSYFPPSRANGSVIGITAGQNAIGANNFLGGQSAGKNSTVNNLIVIGTNSGNSGISDPNLAGTVIVGCNLAPLVTISAGNVLPMIALGSNNLENINAGIDSIVAIGSNIRNGPLSQNISESIYIGFNLFPTAKMTTQSVSSVVIGTTIATAPGINNNSFAVDTIMIGNNLFTASYGSEFGSCIIIGSSIEIVNGAASGFLQAANTAIGTSITIPGGSGNVQIAPNVSTFVGISGDNNVVIGSQTQFGGSGNVVIGANARTPINGGDSTFGCVIIGNKAGVSESGGMLNNLFIIESSGGSGPASGMFYGNFLNGNLIIGNSSHGINRDFGGTGLNASNILKLLNGIPSAGGNPVGGGYFYVSAGALHWVGSSGTDTTLAAA